MKYFAVILSLIIITLIAVPCDHIPVDSPLTSVITPQHDNDSENSEHLCSPFSTNDSCATVVILPEFFCEASPDVLINTEINTTYIFSFTKDFSKNIFQPPRA